MIPIPFNEHGAQLLTALGYTLTSHPADWEDVGGPESGPRIVGHNAYDEWTKDDISVYVEDGHVVEIEKNPPEYKDIPF